MTTPAEIPDAPIVPADLQKFDADLDTATAEDMIRTAWVRALRLAPCLGEEDFDSPLDLEVVKDVLRGAILRWNERGAGAVQQRTAGEYGETLREDNANLFRPNEIRDLQSLCSDYRKRGRASTISTLPSWAGVQVQHAEWCAWNFAVNPTFCDCGALLSGDGLPINGGASQL